MRYWPMGNTYHWYSASCMNLHFSTLSPDILSFYSISCFCVFCFLACDWSCKRLIYFWVSDAIHLNKSATASCTCIWTMFSVNIWSHSSGMKSTSKSSAIVRSKFVPRMILSLTMNGPNQFPFCLCVRVLSLIPQTCSSTFPMLRERFAMLWVISLLQLQTLWQSWYWIRWAQVGAVQRQI